MFLAILIVIFLVCIYSLRNKNSRPPLASGAWPVVGHAVKFVTNLEDVYKVLMDYSMESLRRDAPLSIRIVGTEIYGITDPEDANTLLNSCFEKDVVYSYFKPWIGDGLITASEKLWKNHRKLLNPTFNQSVLEGYLPEVNKQAKYMITQLNGEVGKGKFNHGPYLERATLQCICSTAMGVIIDEKDVELREQYLIARNKFSSGLVERAQKFWLHSEFLYDFSSLKKAQNALANTLHGLTRAIITKRKDELKLIKHNMGKIEQRFKPFIEHLLEMEEKGVLDAKEVQEEVDTFVMAGSDTMSITLSTTLLVIGSYPDVQRNIVKELEEVFQGSPRGVEKQDLLKLKYLEAVVKETLRLIPTVPIVARTLDKDVKIGKYTLPRGGRCFVSLHGVNRHGRWGPDADQFRPERWLEPDCPATLLAAFGFGKRRCIGTTFALMCVKTILAHVLRHYRVSGDVTELRCTMEVVARPVPQDYITIERRIKTGL